MLICFIFRFKPQKGHMRLIFLVSLFTTRIDFAPNFIRKLYPTSDTPTMSFRVNFCSINIKFIYFIRDGNISIEYFVKFLFC